MEAGSLRAALAVGGGAVRGRRPPRYEDDWFAPFNARVDPIVTRAGCRVLDVGGGRAPTIPPERRAHGCCYVGLDPSAAELALAPKGSYDHTVAAAAEQHVPELDNGFDLAVSFYVFEHVSTLDVALEHIWGYLRPGGRLVAVFSGTFSAFGMVNRALPDGVGSRVVARLRKRSRESVFHAYYSGCYHSALDRMLGRWSQHEILPLWRGAGYFDFARPLEGMYLAYEEWAMRSGRRNLAPYYLIAAER